jgi:DNA-binding NarL/FixJ family response regulator
MLLRDMGGEGMSATTPVAAETVPRIVLADDHPLVRQSLRRLLEREGLSVVGEAGDGQEAVDLARRYRPQLAILDLAMPRMNGIEAARRIRAEVAQTRIILLSVHDEGPYVRAALEAGASAYVLKSQAVGDLLAAIRTVLAGTTYVSPVLPQPL